MNEKYIIGIDEGSQSAKILIFDTKGNIVCEAKHALKPYNLPRPGIVELRMTTGGMQSARQERNVWRSSKGIKKTS